MGKLGMGNACVGMVGRSVLDGIEGLTDEPMHEHTHGIDSPMPGAIKRRSDALSIIARARGWTRAGPNTARTWDPHYYMRDCSSSARTSRKAFTNTRARYTAALSSIPYDKCKIRLQDSVRSIVD